MADVAWSHHGLTSKLRILPRLSAQNPLLPEVLEGWDLVLLPTLKAHAALTVGGAVATLFPMLLPKPSLLTVDEHHDLAVDLLATLRERDVRWFSLIDATVCGDGAGPRTVRPSLQNVLVASADPVAADAVAASLMGQDPWSIRYLRRATEAHLGQARLGDLEIVGEDIDRVDFGLRASRSPAHWGKLLGTSPWSRSVGRVLAKVPLARLYQDALWFPLVGTRLRRRYHRTPWGRLALHYRRGGATS